MKLYLIFIASFIFISCSQTIVDPQIDMKPPVYVQELPPKVQNNTKAHPGSLFGKGENPLFSDRKAMKVNDILTVVIDEKTALSSVSKKTISKDNSNKMGAGVFGGKASSLNSLTNVTFDTNSKNSFSGQGTSTRDEKFTTNITARIVKILENGNYFIEGKKELLINGEKQVIQVSGVVRPYDIDETNTINSKYIANAKISYSTQGDLDQATRKPWLVKILEAIWPF